MKSNTRERAIRIILSAIMGSDLKPDEIRSLAKEFLNKNNYCRDIGLMMMDIFKRMDRTPQKLDFEIPVSPQRDKSNFVSKSFSIINARRLAKKNVLAMMRMLIPQIVEMVGDANLSVRELLEMFEENASDAKIDKIIRWLDPDSTKQGGDFGKQTLKRVLSLIKKMQLSKKEVVMKLGNYSSEIEDLCSGNRLNIEEILNIFMEGTSRNGFIEFMNSLEREPIESDEYLNGIMDKN